MGWVMGFEPTNTGTTIRCLRPLGDTHHMKFCCRASIARPGKALLRKCRFARSGLVFLRCCRHPAGGKQQSTGLLQLIVRVPKDISQISYIVEPWETQQLRGTPGGTRTPDLLLRRQLLYPAELLAHFFGAGDGNRTRVSSLEGWCSTIELHPHMP